MSENRQRLLEFCTYHGLCITHSFKPKFLHKVSWRHPRSKHWHQLDLILVRRAAIKTIPHAWSYYSADCDTDHSLVFCKIKLTPKRFHRSKKQGNPCIDISKMSQPNLVQQFAEAFESEYKPVPRTKPCLHLQPKSGKCCVTPCIKLTHYLWQKDNKVTRLVRSKGSIDDPCD